MEIVIDYDLQVEALLFLYTFMGKDERVSVSKLTKQLSPEALKAFQQLDLARFADDILQLVVKINASAREPL